MRRRDFIKFLPLQQPLGRSRREHSKPQRRVSVLLGLAEQDPEAVAALRLSGQVCAIWNGSRDETFILNTGLPEATSISSTSMLRI